MVPLNGSDLLLSFAHILTWIDIQVLLFFIWGFSCCKVSSISFLYYTNKISSSDIERLLVYIAMFLQENVYLAFADWMGFCYENECGFEGFIPL